MQKKWLFRNTETEYGSSKKSFLTKNKTSLFLLLLSFAFISIGIYRDETATVLTKSINICLECIGIG
ncbi:CD1871A family CXXC motif-containing protein [Mediterraneibacter agrestimuris]|uniref:CD1871A family CXXC motif-containing protein n=1 Tax=Mediterraneibacter agrestimuris TaxID=2941333 RepID=UPI002F3F4FD3